MGSILMRGSRLRFAQTKFTLSRGVDSDTAILVNKEKSVEAVDHATALLVRSYDHQDPPFEPRHSHRRRNTSGFYGGVSPQ